MRRKLLTPIVGLVMLAAMLAANATAAFADPRDFTLNNGSDVTITHVYVSTVDTKSWEEDVLGVDILPPGDSVDIVFSNFADSCAYDIKVLAVDGREGYLYGVDLCSTSTVTFS